MTKYHIFRSHDESGHTGDKPFATVQASESFLQTFRDEEAVPDTLYYYQVTAEDSAGNRQMVSPVTSARTPKLLALPDE